jgi:hypothetical protein
MNVPSGFRRWRFHWFECPACSHRSWRAFSNIVKLRERPYMAWRFWCERCGAFSRPANPMLPVYVGAVTLLFVGPVAFAFVYRAMLAGLGFEWLVLLFGALWVASPLAVLAMTWLTYKFVPSA